MNCEDLEKNSPEEVELHKSHHNHSLELHHSMGENHAIAHLPKRENLKHLHSVVYVY
jgi:hypothetical protein